MPIPFLASAGSMATKLLGAIGESDGGDRVVHGGSGPLRLRQTIR